MSAPTRIPAQVQIRTYVVPGAYFIGDVEWINSEPGARAWDAMCDDIDAKTFRTMDAARAIHRAVVTNSLRQARIYARLLLKNASGGPEPCVRRVGKSQWQWLSMAEMERAA